VKKTLSIVLAAILVLMTAAPAFAAGGSYTVQFASPSATLESVGTVKPYAFVQTENGEVKLQEVKAETKALIDADRENGYKNFSEYYVYVELENRYTTISRVIDPGQYVLEHVYEAVECENGSYEEGTVLSFIVKTNRIYNSATVSVLVNGEKIYPNAKNEYSVIVDRDLEITVNETDANGNPVLMRNTFSVKMPSDTGYKVKTLAGENYALVPYGGSFSFRVKISKGYTDSGMTVKAVHGSSTLEGFIGDDMSGVIALIPADQLPDDSIKVETLSSTGVDADGYRTYTITNITKDVTINVSGVREEKNADILAMFKRILKLILDLLGIKSDIFGSITNTYEVNISCPDSTKVTYAVTSGSHSDEIKPKAFEVASGDSITVEVSTLYADCDEHVTVQWILRGADGKDTTVSGSSYGSSWVAKRNATNGRIYYTRVFVIDNITANVDVVITETP